MVFKFSFLVGLFVLFTQSAFSEQVAEFDGKTIYFSYSKLMYSSVVLQSAVNLCEVGDATCLDAFYIKLNRKSILGGAESDSGSVCLGAVAECSKQRPEFGYYLDADGGVNISPPGEAVLKYRLGRWDVIESYPLCAWSHPGGFEPYGGQCYSVLLMDKSRTIGFNFLLGEAGCMDIQKCWPTEISRIRKIIETVR